MRTLIKLIQVLLALAIFWPASSYGTAVYRFDLIQGTGDTVYVSDINDRGDIVYSGFGDSGGLSYVQYGSTYLGSSSPELGAYRGVPVPSLLYDIYEYKGVRVDAIDNKGNLKGIWSNGVVSTPVIWHDMVPYDMTDPANAGVEFLGSVSRSLASDFFDSVTIIGMPYREYSIGLGLTNALGQILITLSSPDPGGALSGEYALLTPIPEPGSLPLFAIALMAAILPSRKRG
jgi:hypothetical protein